MAVFLFGFYLSFLLFLRLSKRSIACFLNVVNNLYYLALVRTDTRALTPSINQYHVECCNFCSLCYCHATSPLIPSTTPLKGMLPKLLHHLTVPYSSRTSSSSSSMVTSLSCSLRFRHFKSKRVFFFIFNFFSIGSGAYIITLHICLAPNSASNTYKDARALSYCFRFSGRETPHLLSAHPTRRLDTALTICLLTYHKNLTKQ